MMLEKLYSKLRILLDYFANKKDYEVEDCKGLLVKGNYPKIKAKNGEEGDVQYQYQYLPAKKVKKCQKDESYS
jgi:hypothetical protein